MRKDLTLQEVISYIVSDLSVKYRLTTCSDWDNENDDVKRFYKHFGKDFYMINKKLSNLEERMVDYWNKNGNNTIDLVKVITERLTEEE